MVLIIGSLLAPGAPRLASGAAFAQTAPSQRASQTDAKPASAAPAPPAVAPVPCPTGSPSASAAQPDCKPASKGKKPKGRQSAGTTSAPTKTVVHNGSTGYPDVDIAPGVSQQQASQQREITNGLLAQTNENLKIVEGRELSASQQDTVRQIRTYMKQSKEAADDGDVQRAYTLANKARMLSGDLVKH